MKCLVTEVSLRDTLLGKSCLWYEDEWASRGTHSRSMPLSYGNSRKLLAGDAYTHKPLKLFLIEINYASSGADAFTINIDT